jgi:hypothetical protein
MKIIPLITITPTIKVQILRSLASWKALLIPCLHKKIQKISIHHHLKPSCPKQQWPKFGHCGSLGVKVRNQWPKFGHYGPLGVKVRNPKPLGYAGFYTVYYKDIGEFQILYLQDIYW